LFVGKLPKSGSVPEAGPVHPLHQGHEGVRVARRAAVVLANDPDVPRLAIFGQLRAAVGRRLHVGRAVVAPRVDPDRVAPQRRGGVDPCLVVLDGLGALHLVGGAQIALGVDHDQDAGDPVVVGPLLEILQIGGVPGLILEELVDELDGLDPVRLAGDNREVEVGQLPLEEGVIQRPLGQRDLEVANFAGAGFAGRLGGDALPEAEPERDPAATAPRRKRRRSMDVRSMKGFSIRRG